MTSSSETTAAAAEPWRRIARWPESRVGDVAIALSLLTALVAARTMGLTTTMWLLGDQIRDWSAVLGSAADLPLSGPPSVAGGSALGPFYYWLLWLIRVTIGPWFDNLPHAGTLGLAIVYAAADVILFFAVRRFSGSGALALATVLLLATAPYDLALSSTVWSPPVAVALVKCALALFLHNAYHPSRWRMVATVAVAWMAVQTHSSTILVFLPLASWFVVRELAARRWRSTVETIRIIIEVVLILQIPYIVDRMLSDTPRGAPTMIVEGVKAVVADPLSAQPVATFDKIVGLFRFLWASPFEAPWLLWLLTASAVGALVLARRRPDLLFVTVLPLAAAVIGFSAWPHPIEAYWFMGLAPAVALMIVAGVCAVPAGRARDGVALILLLGVLSAQSGRLYATLTIHRLQEYGALMEGSRAIAHRTLEIGSIETAFELPPSTDPAFLFSCLGGRVSASAPYDAVIGRDGTVTFRERR